MIWKTLIVAFMAVGALALYQITDDHRQRAREMLLAYCTKNGAADKVDGAADALTTFANCTLTLFDPETIKKEIEDAKPNGALDEVFKKYCAKSPQLKSCMHALTAGLAPCMEPAAREHIPAADNASDQLIDFVCYKDGDRIALFIAEHGPECIQSKTSEIRECGQKLKDNVPSAEAARNLTIAEQCTKFDELSRCVVTALEGCDTPTPGNMAEALFKYVRKGSPCATDQN